MRFRTPREISEEAPLAAEWVLEGYLALGALTEILGKPKVGKTTLMLEICRAILDGQSALDRATTQTKIVYLTEQGRSVIQALHRAGLLEREDMSLLYHSETLGIPWPKVIDQAVAECERIGASVLVVDTLPQFADLAGDDENSAGAAKEALAPLLTARDRGLAVCVLRHERKGGGDVTDAGRGSSAFAAAPDVCVLFRFDGNEETPRRVLTARSRYDETPANLTIEWLDGTYHTLSDPAESSFQRTLSQLQPLLPEEEDKAKTVDELIAAAPSLKRTTVLNTLRVAVERGLVASRGKGVRGNPWRFWRAILSPAPSSL